MTPRPRVVIIGIRVDHHCQYPLVVVLKYGRVKLSAMCVLLCLQLWATTTSFLLPKGTMKLHAHLLVLLLGFSGTGLSWRFYTGKPHTAPSFYPRCTHTCLRQFSSRSSLSLFNGCFFSRIRIRICLPPLISCRSYISAMRSKYYVFAFFDG